MPVNPDSVLNFTSPTNKFLCPPTNSYGIEFASFCIRDYHSKEEIFRIDEDNPHPIGMEVDFDPNGGMYPEDCFRKIKYTFSEKVLSLPLVQTSLKFKSVKALSNFRMIEKYYFGSRLLRSFDFDFGFCIPGGINEWESTYEVPELERGLIDKIVNCPHSVTSDTFYFVGDELVLHNKASYKYV